MRPRCTNCGMLKDMGYVAGAIHWLCPRRCPGLRAFTTNNTAVPSSSEPQPIKVR